MIDAKNVTITDSEWEVMRAIWTMGQPTSRELIDAMAELQGWSDSTTKTLLHRLIKKRRLNRLEIRAHTRSNRLLVKRIDVCCSR